MNTYHIKCDPADIGRYCILPGDPGRCEEIANYLDCPEHIAQNREYNTYTGTLLGERVSVTSTGIGGPSAAIAIEELSSVGAHTFVRVGTCGGIDLEVCGGDIVIASGCVRDEGTSRQYAPPEYPAVPDFAVLKALEAGADAKGYRHHVGVVQSKDSFYGQHDPERMPVSYELLDRWSAWQKLGVLASEMEGAALFVVAAALKVRCGAVFSAVWNKDRRARGLPDEDCHCATKAIETAIEAIKLLISAENRQPRRFG